MVKIAAPPPTAATHVSTRIVIDGLLCGKTAYAYCFLMQKNKVDHQMEIYSIVLDMIKLNVV